MNALQETVSRWLSARVPGARLDETGFGAVRRDDQTAVLVEVPPDGEICHFCALVGPLPEEAREATLLAALQLNRFGRPLGGCWLAWEDGWQALTLCHNLHLPSCDAQRFSEALDNFLLALDHARSELAGEPPPAGAGQRPAPPAQQGLLA